MDNPPTPQSLQDKIDFFLLSAHELRTSLSAMKWLFSMLSDGDFGALNDEQQKAIAQATQANSRMIDLLNSTMTTVKNDDVITYERLQVQLTELVSEITEEFRSEAAHHQIAIIYNKPSATIIVRGDMNRLRIAFHNIIENAIKYSPINTEIVVTLSLKDKTALLVVQDHGAGIPADKKDHLFEKFFRAENTHQKGTGLGLYSTKHIIEQHGGTIAIDSIEGEGTIVSITLPLAQ